jgi:quinol monooxygenase YgiN
MITFIAHFKVPPSNTAAFEQLLAHVVTMSNSEPGVVYYGFARSVDDAETYSVVEVYRDQIAVESHGQTEWVVGSVPKFLSLIDGVPDIKQYVGAGSTLASSVDPSTTPSEPCDEPLHGSGQ